MYLVVQLTIPEVSMRVLVTGATGRIGSRLVPRLLASGPVRVVVRDVDRAGRYWDLGCDVVLGDLREPDVCKRAVAGMDAVLHLATGGMTGRLARAAADAGVARFVVAGRLPESGRGRPVREDDEPEPLLDRYRGLGVRVVRLASVYGAGDPLPCPAGGPAHRRIPTVHHLDAGQGLHLALAADTADGRVYHLADDAALTAWELCALAGRPVPAGAGPVDPWEGVVDTRRIRDELGFRPAYPTVYAAHEAGAL
jgi:nucleoside-diphosphate-sugar epimerase